MVEKPTPTPPIGIDEGGRRLWTSIVDGYELAEHELTLLRERRRGSLTDATCWLMSSTPRV